ncbi:serine hydrolase [Paenibacillus soyae]|uniref:Serine hydrolase n=1 Tax=Paenibacillus soyae TaxID=2969249 RepID=A0A9X2MRU1_9BACL|nr:serine hydrolase [Paenibacillus soyae]MCR2805674.1 serine hydrolase [Paenibacillus soyae]
MMKRKSLNRSRALHVLCASVLAASLLSVPAGVFAETSPSPASALQQSAAPELNAAQVQAFADSYFAQPEVAAKLAGALAVVVKDGKVLLNAGYGYADLATKKKVDPDRTLFRMASITKSVTATAVMQLVEQEKISLNDDITAYMPGVKIVNEADSPVTVEHLLTHTTGFDYTDVNSVPPHVVQNGEVSLEDFLRVNGPSVVRTPGDVYRYDNLASSMQGYIVQQVSKQPFEEYVEEHIFDPLEMKNSAFRMDRDVLANLATGYNADQKPIDVYPNMPTIAPEGGMFASGADMANFLIAHLNKGQFGSTRILEEATAKLMHEIHYDAAGVPLMSYGFESFLQSSHNGQNVIGKGGDLAGYHSWLWLLPEQNVGGLIVVNSDASESVREQFFDAFMDHFYPKKSEQVEAFPIEQAQLLRFEGTYRSLRSPVIATQVTAGQGELLVKDALGDHKLKPVGPMRFVDEDGKPAAFMLGEDGEVAYLYYTAMDSMSEKLPKPAVYEDVENGHPYAEDIYFLSQLQVFGHDADHTEFRPEEPITRAEFVSIITLLSGEKPSESVSSFKDMQDHPLAGYVQNVANMGAIAGMPSGNFEPDRAITRQEAAVIIYRTARLSLGATAVPAELGVKPAVWADEAVQFMVGAGLHGSDVTVDANGAANYRPTDTLLRKEAAAIYSRLIQQIFGF